MRLRLDDHHAVSTDPLIASLQQALLERIGQRRGSDIEAQMNGIRDLVDVLATGALCADGSELDFISRAGRIRGQGTDIDRPTSTRLASIQGASALPAIAARVRCSVCILRS
jgi:hypothetical protein